MSIIALYNQFVDLLIHKESKLIYFIIKLISNLSKSNILSVTIFLIWTRQQSTNKLSKIKKDISKLHKMYMKMDKFQLLFNINSLNFFILYNKRQNRLYF